MTILPTSKKRIAELLAAVLILGLSASATCAEKPLSRKLPWKSSEYTLVARQMPIRSALESFSVAQGIPVLMSDRVAGVLSGDFKGVAPADFLDRISAVHNLTWYYDGTALYIYTVGEMGSTLIDLKYMKADEVLAMMVELGVEETRYKMGRVTNVLILLRLLLISSSPYN